MKYLISAAAAAMLLVSACGSRTSDTGFFRDGPRSVGPLYVCAMQPDPSGAEAEGGQGWIELKVSVPSELDGEWRVFGMSGTGTAQQLLSSGDLAEERWGLECGSVIRLHPRGGYSGDDDRGSLSYGYDGKYDFVCGTDSSPISLPGAEDGCVWVENEEGMISDILLYGSRPDPEMMASAVSSGEWPDGAGPVPCGGASGYLRLSDPSTEGDGPSGWSVCADPSFVREPHVCVSEAAASPASVIRGQPATFSVRAEGCDGAAVSSVGFDLSAVVFDALHSADAGVRTVRECADHRYSYSLDTAGIIPGSYEITLTVNCTGAQNSVMKLPFAVRMEPGIRPGNPTFSFSPSTCVSPGKTFVLSLPVTAEGTIATEARLECAALGIDAAGVRTDAGFSFPLDSSGYAEGEYQLRCTVSGESVPDASVSVQLTVRRDACLAGGDMESAIEDASGFSPPGSSYVNAADASCDVFQGKRSLHISGTSSSNGYVFISNSGCAAKGGFSKLVFRLKGFSGKSLSVNIWGGMQGYRSFNLGTVTGDRTVWSSGSNSYAGSVSLPDWAKITLDLSGVEPGGVFALKFGSAALYDLYMDDIRYE